MLSIIKRILATKTDEELAIMHNQINCWVGILITVIKQKQNLKIGGVQMIIHGNIDDA